MLMTFRTKQRDLSWQRKALKKLAKTARGEQQKLWWKWIKKIGSYDNDFFLTFAIAKSKILKFKICLNETEILRSTFESTESKSESRQSAS